MGQNNRVPGQAKGLTSTDKQDGTESSRAAHQYKFKGYKLITGKRAIPRNRNALKSRHDCSKNNELPLRVALSQAADLSHSCLFTASQLRNCSTFSGLPSHIHVCGTGTGYRPGNLDFRPTATCRILLQISNNMRELTPRGTIA
ncbi:hypothetical protein J6590_086235 [Homalodisca vitripennis]|nr:hypothetical protein J6590_086235 [Homalodisca vitripennis]